MLSPGLGYVGPESQREEISDDEIQAIKNLYYSVTSHLYP